MCNHRHQKGLELYGAVILTFQFVPSFGYKVRSRLRVVCGEGLFEGVGFVQVNRVVGNELSNCIYDAVIRQEELTSDSVTTAICESYRRFVRQIAGSMAEIKCGQNSRRAFEVDPAIVPI